jgi:predicted DNA-binding protein
MTKSRGSRKSPSRRRYEERRPTLSFRLDIEDKERLKEHLEGTGCSPADFVKDALGREEAMVDKRVEILASRRLDASVEDRVRCLENLVHEIFSLTVDNKRYPPLCPRCDNQERPLEWLIFRVSGGRLWLD